MNNLNDSNNAYIMETKNVSKLFPGVKALDNVSFKVKKGEIHCLCGENGAGKSTLMKVLTGVYPYGSYEGDIIINNQVRKFKNIVDSQKVGVAIIYQELALVPALSVYENIFLGHEIKKGIQVDFNEHIKQAKELVKKVGLDINVQEQVKNFGIGKQQLVEIAKALSKKVEILILDEPTAALNEDDSENLLKLIKKFKEEGVTCIMISHKLKEVISVADTVTVIRDGKTIRSLYGDEITENNIIKNMVGRQIDNIYPKRENINIGEVAFEVENISAYDYNAGREILKDISLNVKKGEIVGIFGLMGSGRTELALSVFGNTKNYKLLGNSYLYGKEANFTSPKKAIENGLVYITEDRKGNGLNLIWDIKTNNTIAGLKNLVKGFLIDENKEIEVANEYKNSLKIKAPSVDQKVGNLSGGNQQKVSIAKCLYTNPKVLLLDEPTRGIDVGSKFEIYTLMNKLVEQGMSIVMISSELLEVIGMSDRIYIIAEGELKGELAGEDMTEEKIIKLATL